MAMLLVSLLWRLQEKFEPLLLLPMASVVAQYPRPGWR